MSVVIQAEDTNLGRTVALKFLKKNVKGITQTEQVEQFFREARSAAALEHPNIVQIYGFQQSHGRWFMIMEHMEGGSLLELIERTGPLSPRRACMFMADAASGIAEAHAAGALHRDIKPSNLLLTRTARCKVADFGLVRPNIEGDSFRLSSMPVGSRHYVAPEILRNEPATPAADVYSLAATLYTVMAGRPPFPSDDRHELDRMIREGATPDLRELVPHAPARIVELIHRCMDRNPRLRPNAHEFASILRAELAELTDSGGMGSLTSVGSSSVLRSASVAGMPSPTLQSPSSVAPVLAVAPVPAPAPRKGSPLNIAIGVSVAVVIGLLLVIVLRPSGGGSPVAPAPVTQAPPAPVPAPVPAAQPTAQQVADLAALKARTDLLLEHTAKLEAAAQSARVHAADQAAQQKAEHEQQFQDLQSRAAELAGKARTGNDPAAAAAMEVLDKALAIQPGNAACTKLKAALAALPHQKAGDRLENGIGMTLSYIPSGSYVMGSPAGEKGRDEDENQVRVTITRPFYMGRTEVTQSQWQAVMGEYYKSADGIGDATQFIGPDMPVHNVSWNDAVAFCKRLSEKEHRTYRLPSEAEWEYACRAGTTTPFNTGDNLTSAQAQIDASEPYIGTTRGRTPQRTQRVASFPPNAWGLYDMHGNVAQWCADWYASLPIGEATDPKGPAQPTSLESANRVVRGGAWCQPARTARSASRWNYSPVIKTNYIGFRVVMEMNNGAEK